MNNLKQLKNLLDTAAALLSECRDLADKMEEQTTMLYTVQWCGPDGNLQERRFPRLEDANMEAEALKKTHDWVRIIV